ncbi:MAG: family 43 glycosylhydrolase [Oscillospiraceae bacterium]|nr:family 43 glycosylhydrolase [Oscillospiraceae bacterium]
MKKTVSVLLALAIVLGLLPAVSLAAYSPEYSADELRALGEALFTAPDPGNTSIADQPVRNYWSGWTTDESYASVNYKYYGIFGDYVVQFYKDNKSTNLTKEQSFFPNAQDGAGLGRLIAPNRGLGAGEDFIVLDFNFKAGDTNTCYQDYYFRDADGKLILAVRFDIYGMYVATSQSDITEVGALLEKNVSAVQPFSLAAWNHGGAYSVSLEHDGECVFTKAFEGEINGFGSLDVVIGRYNGTYTHTAIGGLKITSGLLGDITPERALKALNIPYNIDENYQLPASIYGKEITWIGDITPVENTVYTKITASIENETKDFDVMIMGKNDCFIAAYTTNESAALGKSMHLALKTDDGWQPLNFGLGVLFAKAELNDGTVAGTTKVLDKPWLYRKADGKIGVAAKTMTTSGEADAELTLWETDDLVDFTELGKGSAEWYENTARINVSGIDGEVSSVLPISEAEAEYLLKKLGEVRNTDARPIRITTEPGKTITELPALTANYSDGSTEEIPVEWNMEQLKGIDFSKVGAYTIDGIAAVSDYPSPMIGGTADPVIYRYNDTYYFIATNETGGQVDIYIRGADTIKGLASASPVLIFRHTASGDHSGCNWAPELHEIGGELYCLFASSTTGSWNAVQSRAMRCSGDPLDPNAWEAPVRITRADGSPLIAQGITLDMTYFEANGRHYYCWAERPITSAGNGNSQLVIAEMDPADPYKIVTEPVVICIPSYGWDRNTATVDEGPYMLKHDGKLYLTFSGSGVDNSYCVGLLTADENADLLDPESWKETGYPVLTGEHVSGELGPGHNAYTKDEYGRDVIVLHMKPNGGTRSSTARTIHYGFDGTPIFYMTADRYLKPEYRDVTATIIVADENTTEEDILLSLDAKALSFFKPEETTADLMLEYKGKNGSEIAWSSSDPSVITGDGKVTRTSETRTVIMTATLTLGGKTLTREFEFTVLAAEEDAAYLFAYFTGNNADQERLFYGVSRDGLNFRALNGGKSILTSDLGTGCIRDPFIFKGEDGYYYIIATDMRSSLGWSSNYATVVYKTPDLINIVDKAWINYRDFPSAANCTRAWAPQAIWCPEKNAYMVYLAMSIPGDPYATVMYRHYATDLCDPSTYTDVELMLDEPVAGAAAIDGDIIYDKFHGQYIMYYDGKRIATADALSGEWTHAETKYIDGQLPMETASGAAMAVEGSNIWQMIGEDRWIIAADGTAFNGGRYALVETTDFENYTQLWSESGDFSFDFTPRHGYVIPISERELRNLFEAYGEVDLPMRYEPSVSIEGDKAVFKSKAPAKAIVAAYSADGKLISAAARDFSGTLELDLPEAAEVKAFIWDENMRPLAQAAAKYRR